MKKLTSMLFVLLFFTAAGNLFAGVKIEITPPSGTGIPALDAELANMANQFETELMSNKNFTTLGSQDKLATGFGNSTAYASQTGSLAGYQGYDLFAFMYGITLSGQPLYFSPSDYSQIGDDIEKDKDTDAGIGLSTAFNLGLNITFLKNMVGLGEILPNRMYMNIKYFTYSLDVDDFSFETTTFGFGLNYQLIDRGGDKFKLFKWTGVSVGTGFLYNTNKVDMNFTLDEYRLDPYDLDGAGPSTALYYFAFSPDTQFGLDISTYVIPIDVSTSVRLLWLFNFTLGAGLDFTFGESKIVANGNIMDMEVREWDDANLADDTALASDGKALIDGGTTGEPTIANIRVTAGFGICLGPLPLDLSVTYYPITNGGAVNLSTGIVW